MDILRSYLVNLGFHVERGSERQFEQSVGKATARVAEMGAAIEAMGVALVAVVTKMSDRFEDLYYASQRIGSSVENIRAFSFGLSQVGLKAGDAQAALEGLADKMRSSPATEGLLKSLGVQTRDAAGELRDTTQVFEEAMATLHKRYQGQSYFVGQNIAQSWFGVDPRTYLAMGRDFSEFESKQKERFRRYGADQQALAEQGKQFAQRFRDAQASVVTLAEKVFIGLSVRMMPALERFSAWMDKNGGLVADRLQHVLEGVWGLALGVGRIITKAADALVSLDKTTHGASTALLGLLAVWRLLNLGFLATPLGAAIGAIAALGVAIVGLFNDYQTWARGGASLFDWSAWKGSIDGAGKAFGDLADKLAVFGKQASDAVKGDLPSLVTAVSDLARSFVDLGSALAPIAGDFVKSVGPDAIRAVRSTIYGLTDTFEALAHSIRSAADALKGDWAGAASEAGKAAGDIGRNVMGDRSKANKTETDRDGQGRVVAVRRYDKDGVVIGGEGMPEFAGSDIIRHRLAEGEAARKRGPMGNFNDAMREQISGERMPVAAITHPADHGPVKTTVTGAPDVKLKNDRLPPLHPQDRSIFQKIADWLQGQPPPGAPAGSPFGESPRGPEGVRQTSAAVHAAAQQALTYFQSRGWSKAQAAGIVANLQYESAFNARAVGDNGQARGVAQWHPDRQRDFAQWAGHDLSRSTREEQLAFVQYELTQGHRQFAGAMLKHARTARDAGAIISRQYEAPAAGDMNADARGNLAEQIARMTPDAPQPAGGKSVTINSKTDIKVTGADAQQIATNTGREVGRKNADLVRSAGRVVQ